MRGPSAQSRTVSVGIRVVHIGGGVGLVDAVGEQFVVTARVRLELQEHLAPQSVAPPSSSASGASSPISAALVMTSHCQPHQASVQP